MVVAIEEIERLCDQIQFVSFAEMEHASNTQVRRGVVRPCERVAAIARKTIVQVIAVPVGIADDSGIYGRPEP